MKVTKKNIEKFREEFAQKMIQGKHSVNPVLLS